MKPHLFAFAIGLSLAADPRIASAQDQPPQLPTPKAPYIAAVPDYGHWIVTFKYKSPGTTAVAASASSPTAPAPTAAPVVSTKAQGSPVIIETIKTGDLRGVTLAFGDGTTSQFTCQGDWVLSSTAEGPQLRIASPNSVPYAYYTTGFIMLDNMKFNPSTFKLAEKHNGIMSFHYHSGDTDAWIDPESMLPLAAKQEGVEITYQFLTPPPRPFPIPKDQESLLHKARATYDATSSMR